MTPLTMFLLVIVGAVCFQLGRKLTMRRADTRVAHAQQQMRREIAHWQDTAARANAEAARIAREAEAFKDGCKYGREDVISIMPLIVAAQQSTGKARVSGGDLTHGH